MRNGRFFGYVLHTLLVFAYALPLVVLAAFAMSRLKRSGIPPGVVGSGVSLLSVIVARLLANQTLKALGWPRKTRLIECRRPSATPPQAAPGDDEVVIRPLVNVSNAMMWTFLATGAVIFVIAELLVPRTSQSGREALLLIYCLFFGGAGVWYLLRFAGLTKLDAQGITVRDSLISGPTTLSWSRIASCQLIVTRDILGTETIQPVFKDAAGNDLFTGSTLAFSTARREDQQRVLGLLKRRFPKLEIDPWEL